MNEGGGPSVAARVKRTAKRLLGKDGHASDAGEQRKQSRHQLVGPERLWKQKRDFQIAFLRSQGLQPTDQLLDLGCGTLRGGVPLIRYLDPGNYIGIDIRPEAIAEATLELAEEGVGDRGAHLEVVPDLAAFDPGRSFDLVWSFSVLMHMPDELVETCLGFVARVLAPQGRYFANIMGKGEVGRAAEDWYQFPVMSHGLAFYEELAAAAGLEVVSHGSLRSLGHESGAEVQDEMIMLEFRRAGNAAETIGVAG